MDWIIHSKQICCELVAQMALQENKLLGSWSWDLNAHLHQKSTQCINFSDLSIHPVSDSFSSTLGIFDISSHSATSPNGCSQSCTSVRILARHSWAFPGIGPLLTVGTRVEWLLGSMPQEDMQEWTSRGFLSIFFHQLKRKKKKECWTFHLKKRLLNEDF